jgi:hypothetical protein
MKHLRYAKESNKGHNRICLLLSGSQLDNQYNKPGANSEYLSSITTNKLEYYSK